MAAKDKVKKRTYGQALEEQHFLSEVNALSAVVRRLHVTKELSDTSSLAIMNALYPVQDAVKSMYEVGYRVGLRAAASFAGSYNGIVGAAKHNIEDLILAEFSLINKKEMRKNATIKPAAKDNRKASK